jgi:glycosyltransferase involved in cell wall biosynthesis
MGAIELLAERDHVVYVFTHLPAGQPPPSFSSPLVHLRPLGVEGMVDHSTAGLRRAIKRVGWFTRLARAPLAHTYQALGKGLAGGTSLALRARASVLERERAFDAVIGVDPDGLTLAHQMARGAPVVYYSLELLLSDEVGSPREAQLKATEAELSRQAAIVIVQDQARGSLLAEDNHLDPDRLALVPNAPLGPARRRASRYWHQRFDLEAGARVVLHSGSLGDWTGIDAVVDSAASWPEPWVLVIHTRYNAESSSYVDGLRARSEPGRVYFSLKPVPTQEYDPLVDGADVGVAFYVPHAGSSFTQRNVQTIGLSSGKLAYYLRAGLPVIVNRAASIGEVVESRGIGAAVDDAAGIAPALQRVADQYDRFSAAALAFFDDQLDFRGSFGDVVRRLECLQ